MPPITWTLTFVSMEYTGATFSIASFLRFSVSLSSIIDINLGAEKVAGEVSPTSILIIWFFIPNLT